MVTYRAPEGPKKISKHEMIRSVFLHMVIPGQEPGAKDLPKDFSFPIMHQLGIGLVTILDQLRIPRS